MEWNLPNYLWHSPCAPRLFNYVGLDVYYYIKLQLGPLVLELSSISFILLRYICKFRSARKKESEVAQSCPTPCDPMDCSLQGPSVHVIFQARVLEWAAVS